MASAIPGGKPLRIAYDAILDDVELVDRIDSGLDMVELELICTLSALPFFAGARYDQLTLAWGGDSPV